jgi:hypothetical protein
MNTKRKLTWIVIALVLLSAASFVVFNNTSFAQPAKNADTGIEFTGKMNFDVEFLENGFKPPFGSCPATAALIQLDKEQYELRLTEGGACGNRMSIWDLTIDKAGNVTGEAWARMINPPAETGTMLGQWWLHTGCKMTGADPLFPSISGSWDGTTLIADTNFEGYCDGGTLWTGPDLWSRVVDVENENEGRLADGVSFEDGRIHTRFGAELTVVE